MLIVLTLGAKGGSSGVIYSGYLVLAECSVYEAVCHKPETPSSWEIRGRPYCFVRYSHMETGNSTYSGIFDLL